MTIDPSFDRRSGIGASEAAVVLGLDPRRSPFDLWLEKTGKKAPFEGNAWTDLGNRFEPVIGGLYADLRSVTLKTVPTQRHREIATVFASPDFLHESDPIGVEAKAVFNPAEMGAWGESGGREFPTKFAVQCILQAAVFDLESVDLVGLIGGDLRIYRVDRDRDLEAKILSKLRAWWDAHVVQDVAPEMGGSKAANEWLQGRFPAESKPMLIADATETRQLIIELRDAKAALDDAQERFDTLKNATCAIIADAAGIEADGIGSVTWRKTADVQVSAHTRKGGRRFLCSFTNGKVSK